MKKIWKTPLLLPLLLCAALVLTASCGGSSSSGGGTDDNPADESGTSGSDSGSDTGGTTVTVSSDTALSSLTLNKGRLQPAFDSEIKILTTHPTPMDFHH